ncbi:saccharopine dehydrogenase NADP-binding domain-containing protein [Kitasatospora camelliae]|uniref:Saccharopine dehydrogenase NADP-binding domain-containing protein n=1 Tax=Kitasatospora camelliae TaxID=3156397 RepID=A0AAU8JPI1_9ACTN
MRVLVLGGYGAVGAGIVDLLRAGGDTALAAGRDPARADRVLDLRAVRAGDDGAYRAALAEVDLVLNASGAEDPALVAMAADTGAAFVDITAGTSYVATLEHLQPAAPVLLSVGLAPGLSGLLATAAHTAAPGPVDLAIVLGAGERHGAAATEWSYRLLGRRFPDTRGGAPVRNYTRPEAFDVPALGRRRLYRADFSDQHTLTTRLGAPVRSYFGLDSRAATAALAVMTRVPGAHRAPRGMHLPGTDRWWVLARGAEGALRWAHGRSQSHATAVMAVLASRAATGLAPGVHHLPDHLSLADVPEGHGIEIR